MMDWEILPGEGLAQLHLGDDKAAVRQLLGTPRTFRRIEDSPETDQFVDSGILVTYGPAEKVTFIEITRPANPTISGAALLGRELTAVLDDLRAAGLTVVTDPDGASIEGWLVGLYAPSGLVEGVSIGNE